MGHPHLALIDMTTDSGVSDMAGLPLRRDSEQRVRRPVAGGKTPGRNAGRGEGRGSETDLDREEVNLQAKQNA